MSTTETPTPTPRTDAEQFPEPITRNPCVDALFARKLERELNEAKQRIAELERELAQANGSLGAILARIHRDGGHHQEEVGTTKAVTDADMYLARIIAESEEIEEMRAELAALKAAPTPLDRPDAGWQPIEAAPRDGTHIVTAEAGHNGFWFQEDWWPEGMDEWQFTTDPIGWMPLPATPPAELVREGGECQPKEEPAT